MFGTVGSDVSVLTALPTLMSLSERAALLVVLVAQPESKENRNREEHRTAEYKSLQRERGMRCQHVLVGDRVHSHVFVVSGVSVLQTVRAVVGGGAHLVHWML